MRRTLELLGVFAFIAGVVMLGLVLFVCNTSPAIGR